MLEKDLNIYDVWESPNGNLFLKVTNEYSLGLGPKGFHKPSKEWSELNRTQYVKANDLTIVKRVGKIIWD